MNIGMLWYDDDPKRGLEEPATAALDARLTEVLAGLPSFWKRLLLPRWPRKK